MKTPKHSLRKIVTFLNNPDEDGGFWLPNIQRPFVWSEEQMCRLWSLLAGAFSGTPDQLIDDLVVKLDLLTVFDLNELFGVVRSKGRSLEITEDRFWEMGYGSDTIHLLFNFWYRDFDYTPAYENNLPQIDHIFPQSLLRKIKAMNPETGKLNLMKYREADRNQLANCMLLTAAENGAGGKRNTPPDEWFADKPEEHLDMHLIPKDPALWKLEAFEEFVEARKKLIRAKFAWLLVTPHPQTALAFGQKEILPAPKAGLQRTEGDRPTVH